MKIIELSRNLESFDSLLSNKEMNLIVGGKVLCDVYSRGICGDNIYVSCKCYWDGHIDCDAYTYMI